MFYVRLVDEGQKGRAHGRFEFEDRRTWDIDDLDRFLLDECGEIGVRMSVFDAGEGFVVGRNELLDLFDVIHVDALLLDGGGSGL